MMTEFSVRYIVDDVDAAVDMSMRLSTPATFNSRCR